jgi:hypothetical protein
MISGKRNVFVATHLTQEVVDALKKECVKESNERTKKTEIVLHVSRSQLIFELLKKALQKRGYSLKDF